MSETVEIEAYKTARIGDDLCEFAHFYREGRAVIHHNNPSIFEIGKGEAEAIAEMATRADTEITKLKSQLEEARAEIERLKGDLSVSDLQLRAKRTTYIDDKVEEARAMAIEDCIAAARDAIERWSQTEGWLDAKVEDALRALLNGSANKEGGKS